MSDEKKKKKGSKFSISKFGLKSAPVEEPKVLRHKPQSNERPVNVRTVKKFRSVRAHKSDRQPRTSVVPRLRPVSVDYGKVSSQLTDLPSPDEGERTATREAKQKVHIHVEVESCTYGFDVAYSDYLIRYNKLWAVIEILDTVETFRLLRGVVRHVERIGICISSFNVVMKLLTSSNQQQVEHQMNVRFVSMVYMAKSVIVQTNSIQEIIVNIGQTAPVDDRSTFQTLVYKIQQVRQNLEDVCNLVTSEPKAPSKTTLLSDDKEACKGVSTPFPTRKKYNNPLKLNLPPTEKQTTPARSDDAEEESTSIEF